MKNSRLLKNSFFGVISFIIITVMQFAIRKLMVNTWGYEYIGLNNVMMTLMSTLSVAELGITGIIAFALYKPIADNDTAKINSIMKYLRKAYFIIAIVLTVIGLGIVPFLQFILKTIVPMPEVYLIYAIFLGGCVSTYLFSYNHILLMADQKGYIASIVNTASNILSNVVYILIIFFIKNFIVYIAITTLITMLTNILITLIANRKYRYLNQKAQPLEKEDKMIINKKIKAVVYHRVGNYLVVGADNLIISGFLGTIYSGYYANYTMLGNYLNLFFSQLCSGLLPAFGNIVATSNSKTRREVFDRFKMFNFLFYTVMASGLFCVANVFIRLWLGEEGLLSSGFLILFTLNFFITGYSVGLEQMRSAAGVFEPDRFFQIFVAGVNLVLSIVLVNYIGIIGVLVGTTVTLALRECLVRPYITCRYVFNESPKRYYLELICELLLAAFCVGASWGINSLIKLDTLWLEFLVKGIISVIVPIAILSLIYFKNVNFKYVINLFVGLVKKVFRIKPKAKNLPLCKDTTPLSININTNENINQEGSVLIEQKTKDDSEAQVATFLYKVGLVVCYTDVVQYNEMIEYVAQQSIAKEVEIIGVDNTDGKYTSCASALNFGASISHSEVLLFLHQDVLLEQKDAIDVVYHALQNNTVPTLVGVAGVIKGQKTVSSAIVETREKIVRYGNQITEPVKVEVLDECVLAMTYADWLCYPFDEVTCNHWHLYGAELSYRIGLAAGDVVCLPLAITHLSKDNITVKFYQNLQQLAKKYKYTVFRITTPCVDVKNSWFYIEFLILRKRLGNLLKKLKLRKETK